MSYTNVPVDEDETYDVVLDHQQWNCALKAPSADHLHQLATHHRRWPRCILDSDSKEVVPDLEPEEQLVEGKDDKLQYNALEEPAQKTHEAQFETI